MVGANRTSFQGTKPILIVWSANRTLPTDTQQDPGERWQRTAASVALAETVCADER